MLAANAFSLNQAALVTRMRLIQAVALAPFLCLVLAVLGLTLKPGGKALTINAALEKTRSRKYGEAVISFFMRDDNSHDCAFSDIKKA